MKGPEGFDYRSRMIRIRSSSSAHGLDALLFFDMANVRYLAGFTGSDGALLLGMEKTLLLVDGRYTTQAGREAPDAAILEYREKIGGVVHAVLDQGWKRVGIESATITLQEDAQLRREGPGVEWVPLLEEVRAIRAVKDPRETEKIRTAAKISADALTETLEKIRQGVEEKQIALELEFQIRRRGADHVAFDIIVASGENSAMPHATPGTRRLRKGDFIVLDYGAVYEGYRSDETCTVAIGPVSDRQREIYRMVREAHDRAIASVKAGTSCRDVDRIARNHLEENGLARFFSHGTGHGVGLCVHEEPRISSLSESILETGMVVTIEPGVYIPGSWGIRIEDMVLVQEDGCEVLTIVPKDLRIFPEKE